MQVSTTSAVTTSIAPPILPAVSTTSTSSSTVPIIEYPLKGGVTICDRTNGVAQVIFSQELTNQYKQSAYQVLIQGRKIVLPTSSNPKDDRLIFTGSLRISFEFKGDFIEMIETDAASATTYYIDPRKVVEEVAYDAYSYVPMEIRLEDAQRKIENIKTDFPHFNFTGAVALYNRHGVAVQDYEMGKYVLYWANPSEERVKKVDCSECDRRRDGGSSIAKAKDGKVNFRYYPRDKVFALNGETATPLPIPGATTRLPIPLSLGATTRLPLPLPLPLASSSTTAPTSTPSNVPLPASTDRKEAKS